MDLDALITFLDSKHGIVILIAVGVVAVCLNILLRVGEFVFKIFEKKSEVSEQSIAKLTATIELNTRSMDKLECRLALTEKELAEIPTMKKHLNRFFSALKHVAGDEWPKVSEIIMADEKIQSGK